MSLTSYRKQVDSATAAWNHARQRVKSLKASLIESTERLEACLEGQKFLQATAAGVQETAHAHIAGVVSRCLEAVFEEPYEFKVVFEQKRGKTEARLTFLKGGKEHDPEGEVEGGVIDVSAFALRVSKIVLQRPTIRRVLFLDEPFRMLDRTNAPRVRGLLESLARDLGFQFIQVTHNPALAAGRVIEL